MPIQEFLRRPIVLSLVAGLLFCLSWPAIGGMSFLIFGAFIPLLVMEQYYYDQRAHFNSKRIFFPAFLGFFLWNIGTTFFILYIREPDVPPMQQTIARVVASGITYVLNSSFMAIVFWLFHRTRRNVGGVAGYAALILYWMTFEYIHMHWSINWPWLNLGNVFAQDTHYVQWFEYTGSPGGTFWVLLVNILLFTAIKSHWQGLKGRSIRYSGGAFALIAIPVLISVLIYTSHEEKGEAVEVVCVQPNLDPYEVKFKTDPIRQLERMIELCDSADTENTRFYVLPETALQEGATVYRAGGQLNFQGLWEHQLDATISARLIRRFLADKDAAFVVGSADREYYTEKESPSARYIEPLDIYYDSYNSTYLVTKDGVQEFYRKSKLVPGVESIPFVSVLSFLDDLALDLGGASGSLGIQKEREVFKFGKYGISPTICYESVFGDFNTEFVRNGSNAIFISTNDSWWQDSPGYKQLLHYGRLRAIETRRGIARSANTGITCFIDQKGDITSSLEWVTEGALKGEVYFNDEITFYAQHGDYLSRVAALISVLLLLWTWVRPLKGKLSK